MRHIRQGQCIESNEVMELERKWKRTFRSWVYLDTYVHMMGNHELRLDNCMKILEYNEVLVRLQTRDMLVVIWGTGLEVSDYNDSSVIVRGTIDSVQLQEKR